MGTLKLTFDDGPDPLWTPLVLEALADAHARATFFVLAPAATAHPHLIARIRDEGHTVGLHAFAHRRHPELADDEGAGDTDRALAALAELGVVPASWRTPWGVEARWTRGVARDRGLEVVGWDADTHDWRGDDAATMLAAVAPLLGDGTVVLAHDALGPGARRDGCAETVAVIAPLVAAGRAVGLEPESLP